MVIRNVFAQQEPHYYSVRLKLPDHGKTQTTLILDCVHAPVSETLDVTDWSLERIARYIRGFERKCYLATRHLRQSSIVTSSSVPIGLP